MTDERLVEIAKQLQSLVEELNEHGIILGGFLEGKHSTHDYLVSLHTSECVSAELGKVSYEAFLDGQINRIVKMDNVVFHNILTKQEAKKQMAQDLLA